LSPNTVAIVNDELSIVNPEIYQVVIAAGSHLFLSLAMVRGLFSFLYIGWMAAECCLSTGGKPPFTLRDGTQPLY